MPRRVVHSTGFFGVMFFATCTVAILMAMASEAAVAADSAADVTTRRLLDAVDERGMPDVSLDILDRIGRNPDASAELKREIPFRRSAALVAISRREADGGKRAALLDEAQASLDEFLASGPTDDRLAIAAFTQKGTLLVERGRAKIEQARRPGADAAALRSEAARFLDEGIAALAGTVKPDQPVTEVKNAEDAVIKALREVNARIDAIKKPDHDETTSDDDKGGKTGRGKPRPRQLGSRERQQQAKTLKQLAAEQETLQSKLIQTRLMVADAIFTKADAYDPVSQKKDWTKTVEESTARYKEIADKYSTMGGGLLARCYQGRNDALLGKWKQAIDELAPITVLDPDTPIAVALRAKAMNTMLECLLAEKNYEGFQDVDRQFALSDVSRLPGGRLDADWLGLKFRAATLLDARATALDEKDSRTRDERNRLTADARKLATEVARANADYAAEARSLAAKLGKTVAEGEQTFASMLDLARQSIGLMQASLVDAKAAAGDAAKGAAAKAAAQEARAGAVTGLRSALALAHIPDPLTIPAELPAGVSIDEVNEARYLLAYLLYEDRQFEEAAAIGRLIAERYPNAKGGRQAARIGLAAWQQLAQTDDPARATEAREQAREQAVELAAIMMRTWPDEAETADAAAVAIASASAAHDAAAIAEILGTASASSPRRAEILLRGGTALWREVQQAQRLSAAPPAAATEATLSSWKQSATQALDDGLATVAGLESLPPAPLGPLVVAGGIARGQIALDDGDTAAAVAVLDRPGSGPWTLAGGPRATLTSGSLAEAALTLSLLVFIQTEDFERAQAAMKRLEDLAGTGEAASAKLTGMYLAMGRELQTQLEGLAREASAGDAASRDRARKILQGFTTFLDAVAERDHKPSSQIWVATTYLALGSGEGTGAVVPEADAETYLRRAAAAYERLLATTSDPDVARFEPSIRLQLAGIQRRLGNWNAAREQVDSLLADPGRRNSLEVQVLAAEVLQGAGEAAAQSGDTAAADRFLHQAAAGDKAASIWGWAQIATRLERQGIGGSDEKATTARAGFFSARLHLAESLVARARLPDAPADARQKRLDTAATVISMTRKLYPDLGGRSVAGKFDRLQETIGQK